MIVISYQILFRKSQSIAQINSKAKILTTTTRIKKYWMNQALGINLNEIDPILLVKSDLVTRHKTMTRET